jgi:3'(2'), 5'-bisphosphate nucleotidase
MTPNAPATTADHDLAASVVSTVADVLLPLRARLLAAGTAGGELGDAGDAEAQRIIDAVLERRPAGDAVLSEEAVDDPIRLDAERVWIIDPLDGTREFSEPGREDWAVHAALCVGGRPVAAAVALPALGEVHRADAPAPLRPVPDDRPLRMVVSRTRAPTLAGDVAAHLGAELVPMGSAGAKVMAVVRGEAEVYLHAGGQYEWDSCAPVGVALAAGLHASRLDGSPLVYNRPDPRLGDLVVCRAELAEELLSAIAAAGWTPQD